MSSPEGLGNSSTWKHIGGFFLDWVKSLGLYVVVVVAGTILFLISSSMVGYLAYSDRPGPGWGRGVFSWAEVKFFIGWLPLLAYFLLFLGAALFPFARILGRFHSPRWVIRVFGGAFAGVAALIGVLSSGWYIAISQYPVYAGAVCGLVFGALLLPRFSGPQRVGQRGWKQWAGIASTIIACGAFVAYPLVPKQPEQSLELIFVRVIPGPQDLTTAEKTGGLSADDLGQLKALGLSGTLDFGMTADRGTGSSIHARAVIVCIGDLRSPVELREPRGTSVMYVQNGSLWKMFPADAPTLRNNIKFWPSAKVPKMIEVQSGSSHSTFSWYPPLDIR